MVAGILPLNYARIPISRQYKGLRHFVKSRSVPFDAVKSFSLRYLHPNRQITARFREVGREMFGIAWGRGKPA